ncbi:uncharacterized protein LOC114125407 [Aphis gossypii]|uniref:Uncharacterized protein n=1 Tax=Aphis gossypii TaxID=80765 RepID=A0A9P0NLQ9_APHGO|nr:uncharacterized protein LOC114125407 [Aphis gossypii]CAH1725203.1 unnamed protein product [Aphis gossypii]
MIVSCKCLNIHVETKDDPIKFDKRLLGGGFFSKELLCCEVIAVTKHQDCLILEERAFGWSIFKCLNCDMLCYAVSLDKNKQTILISPDLLTDPKQIQELKNSECYSPIYEIVINLTDSNQLYSPRLAGLVPPKVKALQRQMSEVVEKETKLVEDRIRKFTENQYSTLEEFRTKAQNDYYTLARIISEKDKKPKFENLPARTSANKMSSPIQQLPKPTITTLKNNPTMNLMDFTFKPYTKDNENSVSSKPILIKKPTVGGSNDSGLPPASFDAEGLFPLEDMENLQIDCASDDDLSESEGESGSHDEGIYIPHHKKLDVAASLPVDIPRFMVHSGSVPSDINPRIPVGRDPEQKMDIAASIKALAKSVHGDRIFGELPRPRLGSQI